MFLSFIRNCPVRVPEVVVHEWIKNTMICVCSIQDGCGVTHSPRIPTRHMCLDATFSGGIEAAEHA